MLLSFPCCHVIAPVTVYQLPAWRLKTVARTLKAPAGRPGRSHESTNSNQTRLNNPLFHPGAALISPLPRTRPSNGRRTSRQRNTTVARTSEAPAGKPFARLNGMLPHDWCIPVSHLNLRRNALLQRALSTVCVSTAAAREGRVILG